MATQNKPFQVGSQNREFERLSLAVEGLNTGIWDWDIPRDEVYWSPLLFRQLGYKPDEIRPSFSTLEDHLHPEDLELFRGAVSAHLEQEEKCSIDCRLRCVNNLYRWFHIDGQVERSEFGKPNRFVGCVQSIADGKERDRYRLLVETTLDWVWEMNLEGRHTYSNHRIEDILGYTVEEFYELNIFDLFHPEDRQEIDKHFPDLVSVKGGWSNWDIRVRAKDGTYRYLESNAVPILDSSDELVGFRGIDRDVTERRLEQHELRERLQFEMLVSELSTSFINVPYQQVDEELSLAVKKLAKFFDLDRCKLCRFLPEENLFTVCQDYVAETTFELPLKVDTQECAWNSGQVGKGRVVSVSNIEDLPEGAKLEREYMRTSGIKAFLSIPTVLDHQVMGALHVADCRLARQWTDGEIKRLRFIAELLLSLVLRKQQELELERTRSMLLASVESSPAGIIIVDAPDGKLQTINSAALEILGEPSGMALGFPINQYAKNWQYYQASGKIWEDKDLPLSRAIRHGETSQNVDVVVGRSRDEKRWLLVNAAPIRDAANEVIAAVAVFIDITELKRAGAEREKLIQELENKNAELERFTYTVSHDLKSPLITIKGFLGLLFKELQSGDMEKIESRIQRIYDASDQMSRLLNELLELSRIGRIENARELVSVTELAQQAANLVGSAIESQHVKVDIEPDLPNVLVDRIRMVEVFQNLIENAVKFAGHTTEPSVKIGVQQRDGFDVYFVADNGIGVAPAYQEKVFGLFERLDPKFSGTGIGLAIVKRIIEVHGGKVWIESEGEGFGARVCFTVSTSQSNE